MKLRTWFLCITAGVLLLSLSAQAHHSFSGAYTVEKTIMLKGKIIQIALRSPHSFFYVEAADTNGNLKQWAVEGASAGQFAQQGVDSSAFKVGDPVEVTANPSRTPNSTRARLVKIVRTTDGKSWGTRASEVVE